MSERRRVVTINPYDGTVTTVKDLEDGTSFVAVRDSFKVKTAARQVVSAAGQGRYAGSWAAGEQHENGTIEWKSFVQGASVDAIITNAEAMLGVFERSTLDTLFEWRPEGATASVYYEIRGAATYQLDYQWGELSGVVGMYVDVSVPVAPLARGDLATQTISSTTMPAVTQLGTAIGGDAPALVDVAIRCSGGSAAPQWAMIAWTARPASVNVASTYAPFGVIQAEAANNSKTTFTGSLSDANYSGSDGVRTTASGAGTASLTVPVDPSVMQPDEFTRGTIDVEVWARIELAAAITSPKLTLSLEPGEGSSYGASRYDPVHGSAGKLLVSPTSGTRFRFVRLGTLTMPVDAVQPLKWNVKVAASWGAGSGSFGIDYLVMVPSRQRALSRTGVPLDSAYPSFISSTSDTNKLIRSDLSGAVAKTTGNFGPDKGLGGSRIWMPPGNVDVLVKLSSLVPDDPTLDATSEQLSHTGVTAKLYISPRYWLAKGA